MRTPLESLVVECILEMARGLDRTASVKQSQPLTTVLQHLNLLHQIR